MKLAFQKLRKNQTLETSDKRILQEFIDEFTTVSIHGNTVGQVVAKIAQDVINIIIQGLVASMILHVGSTIQGSQPHTPS